MRLRNLLAVTLLALVSGPVAAQDSRLISGNGRVVFTVQGDGRIVVYVDDKPVPMNLIDGVLVVDLPGTTPPTTPPVSVPPPNTAYRMVDKGGVMTRGPPGTPCSRLDGMISPTRVWQVDGAMWMDFICADGNTADGRPAHRRLFRVQSTDGGRSWAEPVVIQEWSLAGNPEEGVFSATTDLFSAITAISAGTESVWSDVRSLTFGHIVIDNTDRELFGWGDEIFVHSVLSDGSILYIAKGRNVFWGLGRLYPDGRSERAVTGMVIGGGFHAGYVVMARDFNPGGSRIEWYDEADLSRPVYSSVFGARHGVPFWDGEAWWFYGRTPGDRDEIRRWRLEDVPSVPSNPADELDLSQVTWLHADISDWTVSSTVSTVTMPPRTLCVFHTMAGRWPTYVDGGVRGEGNAWVFANIGGQWYGATFEWLRPGQECKPTITRENLGPHTKISPMQEWVPRSGETVGFAMSTPARSNLRTSNERSNVVLVVWP